MKKFTDKIEESVEGNNLPTAWEFIISHPGHLTGEVDDETLMIEFAKLHVEAALKEASEKVELSDLLYEFIEDSWESGDKIKKESILTAYPLENIK